MLPGRAEGTEPSWYAVYTGPNPETRVSDRFPAGARILPAVMCQVTSLWKDRCTVVLAARKRLRAVLTVELIMQSIEIGV
jgi:hypothetical protein